MAQITPDQLNALRRYATAHGRYWKMDLRRDWVRGKDETYEYGAFLRQLRNNPHFNLTKFRLEKKQ